jgi:hypothetical protein
MTDKTPELTKSPLMYPVKTLDFSNMNLAGVGENEAISGAYEEALKQRKALADSLEQRYAQPNLFKIASGFLKPQLGGFSASLGSASEAMGENVEQQRAIQPTIAQMRAEIAAQEVPLNQRYAANQKLNDALKKPGGMTSEDVAIIANYDQGLGKVAQEKFQNQSATLNNMLNAIRAGEGKTDLVSKFGVDFVNLHYPSLIKLVPGRPPESTTGTPPTAPYTQTSVAATNAKPAGETTRPLGVPESMVSDVTKGQELKTTAAQIDERMKETQALQTQYGQQSTSALPIYNTAVELYTLASKPYMAPAFAVFEKGDPMGILGKALEAQNVSEVLKRMRDQITTSRMNSSDKASAMSDLQAMENSLGKLQTDLQNRVINPTDARTMFESKQVPGAKNTQDAFLRGIARIGSDALGAYETNTVFNDFLKRKDADIRDWQKSPEFLGVQNNLSKRNKQVITNVAGSELPSFMKSGIEGGYKYQPAQRQQTSGGGNRRMTVAEARRLANQEAASNNP